MNIYVKRDECAFYLCALYAAGFQIMGASAPLFAGWIRYRVWNWMGAESHLLASDARISYLRLDLLVV